MLRRRFTNSSRLSLGFAFAASVGTALIASDAAAAPSPSNRISGRGGNTGVGLSLGAPTGLSVKHFLLPAHALQFHVGWFPIHRGDGGVSLDYLWTPGVFVSNSTLDFMPYLGLGVGVGFDSDQAGLFVKPPLGLAIHWKDVPLDTVLEGSWAPYIIYGPCSRGRDACWVPDAGEISVKVRYYF